MEFLVADWDAPKRVRAVSTLRGGGVSTGPYAALNLGHHVGDDSEAVAENRRRLRQALALPAEPVWMNQVHGSTVVDASRGNSQVCADASVVTVPGLVAAVLTADCLPVVLCDRAGTCAAVAHAGWRGLAAGVLEQTVAALDRPAYEILAWLGPAIGPKAFEVGGEVRQAFMAADPLAESAFVQNQSGRWFADLYALARQRLARVGVSAVFGGERCTFSEGESFFSYRREGTTGRMATVVWLDD